MTLADTPNEFQLDNMHSDLISNITFSPSSNQFLLTSSWDSTLRLFDVINNAMRLKRTHEAPVLDCCFQDAVHCFSGGLDGKVKMFDINADSEALVGEHDAGVKCIEYYPYGNAIVTGSWDKQVKLWDPRSNTCANSFTQPDKVYTMAICDDQLIVGTAGRRVLVWDLKMGYAPQRRESSLKYQTRCIRCFPDKTGYVLSSIEGRVAVEYLNPIAEVQKKKYAFKCHRIKENNGVEMIYPVNTIAFHNGYSTFATGGSDGFVNIWDGFNKKRLCQFRRYPTHISSLAFSPDGTSLAIASSFIHEAEVPESPTHAIYIKTVTDQETKPK